MQPVELAIDRFGSIATRRQLIALGYSRADLSRAVSAGIVSRVRRGWYASRSATREQLVAVRVGGRLTNTSAARSFGLWAGTDTRVHVALQRGASRLRQPVLPSAENASRPLDEVVRHWTELGRIDQTSDTWRVPLFTCLRSVVRRCDRETAIACLDTAMRTFALTQEDIAAIFANEPARSRLIASRAHGGCDSGIESIACQRFTRLGLPVRHQVRFRGIRPVDLVVGRRVIVELDGREFHAQSAAFSRDRRNDAELVALGYVILRFTYAQVMYEWAFVERTVLAALASHP